MNLRPGRIIGITLGAVAILAIGVYGPAMLLGPLPEPSVRLATTSAETSDAGAAAPIVAARRGRERARPGVRRWQRRVARGRGRHRGRADRRRRETGDGARDARVAAPARRRRRPRTARSAPPTTPTTCGTRPRGRAPCRSRPATPGPSAMSCAPCCSPPATTTPTPSCAGRSAASMPTSPPRTSGSTQQGFTATRVADATGLSGDNVGTPEELTRLAALVLADPELAAIYEAPDSNTFGARNVPDVVDRLGNEGIRAIARSYTDEAGRQLHLLDDRHRGRGRRASPRHRRDDAHARLRHPRRRRRADQGVGIGRGRSRSASSPRARATAGSSRRGATPPS